MKSILKKTTDTSVPESPTTARELDFEDDNQESAAPQPEQVTSPPKQVSFQEEAPPPKPPRPLSPKALAEATLIEAFPSIDAKVVRAVLVASDGNIEPAFNALLSMSDPNFVNEEAPPPRPPRPPRQPVNQPMSQPMSQLESDELYARQLAEEYNQSSQYDGFGSRTRGDPPLPRRRKGSDLKPNELYEGKEHSFFDDDLPIIRQNIQKGFQETQQKVNKWISDFRKRLDGDEDDPPLGESSSTTYQRQNSGLSKSDQLYGIRKSAEAARRSADRDRYDSDPRVLGDDFAHLELHDNEELPPRKPPRPLANPDLFKPTPTAPKSGPVDEADALYRQPTPTNRQTTPNTGAKSGKKWQPLTSIVPHPEPEDNDPFSLGDSDEEQDKKTDLKPEDTERLKKSAGETGTGAKMDAEEGTMKPTEQSGSVSQKDMDAEEISKKS